jgi:VanZ family protein
VTAPSRVPDRRTLSPARLLWLWGPVVLYAALIFALSSASDLPSLPDGISDKAAHLMLYSGFGFLLARALAGGLGRVVPAWVLPLVVVAAVLYGLSDEMHQLFVPSRQFDLLDLAADAAGAGLGAGVLWLWGIIARPGDALS